MNVKPKGAFPSMSRVGTNGGRMTRRSLLALLTLLALFFATALLLLPIGNAQAQSEIAQKHSTFPCGSRVGASFAAESS